MGSSLRTIRQALSAGIGVGALIGVAGCREIVELDPGGAATCAVIGAPCGAATQCCSRACADDGSGARVCEPLGGCNGPGEACAASGQCCGGSCVAGTCAESTACAAAGDVCRVAGDPSASRECCSTPMTTPMTCRPTTVGVDRCGRPGMPACLAAGAACATPEDCCSTVCIDEGGGVLTCNAGCRAGGETCSRSVDCCAGNCRGGYCVGARDCEPLGAPCAEGSTCCSGTCGGTCVAPPI